MQVKTARDATIVQFRMAIARNQNQTRRVLYVESVEQGAPLCTAGGRNMEQPLWRRGTVLRSTKPERLVGGPGHCPGCTLSEWGLAHLFVHPWSQQSQELNATQVPIDGWLAGYVDGWTDEYMMDR